MQKSSLSDKVGVVVFSRVLTTLIELITGVAIIRLLSKSDFAIFSYLFMVYYTARYLASVGFPDSVFYFFERISSDAKRAFAFQTCAILFATGLLSSLGILLFKHFVPNILSDEWTVAQVAQVQTFLPYMALIAVLEIPTWPVNNILLAADRQKVAAWYQVISNLLALLSLIVPLALKYPLVYALIGMSIYALVRFIGSFILLWKLLPGKLFTVPRETLKEQIIFAIPLGLSSLVSRLNKYIDKFVVSAFLPAAALAEYNVGAQEIPIVSVIPFAVGSVLISRFVRFVLDEKKDELLDLWYKSIGKVSLLIVPLSVMFITVAHDFIPALFGKEYRGAIVIFQIYTLIILQRVTSYGGILQALGDSKSVLKLSFSLLALNLALNIPFTILWQSEGTALATFFANMFSWYLALKVIGKHLDLPFYKVLPFPFYFRVLGVATACGLASWFIRHKLLAIETPYIGLIITVSIYLTLFYVIATLLKIVTRDDWKKISGWLGLGFLR